MLSLVNLTVTAATAFGLVLVGGGLYEFLVVDPAWPTKPEIVQPDRGGISRRRFWIPAHCVFELLLIAAIWHAFSVPDARFWLLTALLSHGSMRIWSAFDFIPKAVVFEKAQSVDPEAARKWSRRSRWRFPLDVVTCVSLFSALWAVYRG